MTFRLISILFVLPFWLAQISSCSGQQHTKEQEKVKEIFNVDKKVEFLFFYTKESTSEQRKYFDENILVRNTDRGQYMRDGVKAIFRIERNGYEGSGISFRPEATELQREDFKKRLEESPLVYRIYENVVPEEIDIEAVVPTTATPRR